MENDGKSFWQKARKIGKFIGPGFITGASDDDPSGIATYSQTGAQFGYGQLWVALFSYPFMTVIQEMCGRIGLVTGDGLAGVIKKNYGRKILFGAVTLLLLANIVNIGADLGAMASAGELVFGVPFSVWLFGMAIFTILLEINISYPVYAKFLKYFTLSLFAYVLVVFVVKQDWTAIAISTFIPDFSFSKEYIFNIVALLGTTISPYLFFWQADEEVEEEMEAHKISGIGESIPIVSDSDVHTMRIDTIIGMFFSNRVPDLRSGHHRYRVARRTGARRIGIVRRVRDLQYASRTVQEILPGERILYHYRSRYGARTLGQSDAHTALYYAVLYGDIERRHCAAAAHLDTVHFQQQEDLGRSGEFTDIERLGGYHHCRHEHCGDSIAHVCFQKVKR